MRRLNIVSPRLARERARLRLATACLVGDDDRLARNVDSVREIISASHPHDEVLRLWELERLTAFATHRAAEIGLTHPAWTERAAERRTESERAAIVHELTLSAVARLFEREGIPAVSLKGPLMARRLYGDPALRWASADLDILVPKAELFRAADLLVNLGWEPPKDPLLANGLPQHHLELRGTATKPTIELHWRVEWYDDGAHAAGLLDRREAQDPVATLAPVDQLDLLLLCWARDGFHGLRLGVDVAAWWRAHGQATERAALAGLLDGRPQSRAVAIASTASASLFATPALAPPGRIDRAAEFAHRIALTDRIGDAPTRSLTQRALVDVLVCPPPLRGERFDTTWRLAPELSADAHQWAPAQLVPVLRSASAARTLVGAFPLAARAACSRDR